jgi:hypothetical protein
MNKESVESVGSGTGGRWRQRAQLTLVEADSGWLTAGRQQRTHPAPLPGIQAIGAAALTPPRDGLVAETDWGRCRSPDLFAASPNLAPVSPNLAPASSAPDGGTSKRRFFSLLLRIESNKKQSF